MSVESMRAFPPGESVRVLDRSTLESLLLAGLPGLTPQHLLHADKLDTVKEAKPSKAGEIFYVLRDTPEVWSHRTLIPLWSYSRFSEALFPPGKSVRVLDRSTLESLLLAGLPGLAPQHLVHAGKVDVIEKCEPSGGRGSYVLRDTPEIWSHGTLEPLSRPITVNRARPRSDRPRGRFERIEQSVESSMIEQFLESSIFDSIPSFRIYVGNLSYSMSDTALLKMFIKFGEVQAASIVIDRMSQRSKGFGFVRMANETEAASAINALHNAELLDNGELVNSPESNDSGPLAGRASMMHIIETASREMAKMICYDPGKLQELEWRDLERMLAVVFDGIGYAVRLTRPAKDGGKDIVVEFVASKEKQSYYIEIKHWVSGPKVGKHTVRELLSVVVRDQRQGGVIISTSGFTASAMQGITEIERKKLRFGNSSTVVALCRTYLNVSSGLIRPVNYTDMLMSFTADNIEL